MLWQVIMSGHWWKMIRRIWIASLGGGLQCLEPSSGTFETYTSNNSALLENNVTSLCWGDDNTLFFGTANQGVGMMDMRTREIKKVQGQSGSMKMSNDAVNHVYKDSRGLIWIATREGLNVYDVRRHLFLDLSPVAEAKGSFIAAITEDQERNMWVSTSRKVIRVTVASDGKGSYLLIPGLIIVRMDCRIVILTSVLSKPCTMESLSLEVYMGSMFLLRIIYAIIKCCLM